MPSYRRRLIILFAFLTAWALIVAMRLVYVSIIRHDDYVARARQQQERTLSLTPVRGSIRDAGGRVLAESVDVESIYADPQAIRDWRRTATLLASVTELSLNRSELERRLRGGGEFAWIARQAPASAVARVRAWKLPGIYFLDEHRRSYPRGSLAANVIGYVSVDGMGLAGIEYSFDSYVKGKAGKVTLLRDARRGMYQVGGEGSNAAVDGQHIVLTLDEVVQHVAESALARTVKRYNALGGSVTVMDPRDGRILAMASYPTFDPNRFRQFSPDAWRNRAVQDLYEPGSTFKIVAAAGGLEEGLVTPSQILDCGPGYIEIANTRIREHDGNQYGFMSFEDVLVHSSNVGTIRVGLALGKDRFYRYVRAFGFGERTGLSLPGEGVGLLREPRRWSKLSNAVISIGQEIGVTPLQMLRAMCVIANGGMRVEPRIVEKVVDDEGHTIYTSPQAPAQRVISEKSSAILNEILKAVVQRGTGQSAALAQYVVAGKTGTAQKVVRGGYSLTKSVASFAGYAPADRPRVAILVVIDEPRGAQYGGVVAAPVFREVAESTLRYLRVEPSLPERRLVLAPIALAAISHPKRSRAVSSPMGIPVVPDLKGLDGRAAIARATEAGFRVSAQGSGVVVSQDPLPGSSAAAALVRINMAPRLEKGS